MPVIHFTSINLPDSSIEECYENLDGWNSRYIDSIWKYMGLENYDWINRPDN